MKRLPLHPLFLAGLLAASALGAAEPPVTTAPPPVDTVLPDAPPVLPPAAAKPKKKEDSRWVFSLLPKSFQKNPNLEMSVITEVTDLGKKLPPVSPTQPAYYAAKSGGPHAMGESLGAAKILPEADVMRILTRALGASGYHEAKPPETKPSLLIIYTWGTHNQLTEADPENPTLSPEMIARNMLDRAALIGGEKLAKEMIELFQETNEMYGTDPATAVKAANGNIMSPIRQFEMRSDKNEFLIEQMADDVYWVVASAYDYSAVAKNERHLLWRTRMTVASRGINQQESMPTLIAAATPYFGKEMAEPEVIYRKAVPEGQVEIGTPTVVEAAPDGAVAKPAGKK